MSVCLQDHGFFLNLDWTNLLRQKVEFVPQLDDDEDTSYFDSKSAATPVS